MIICTGEILADMIGKIEDGRICYDRFAGGAPFNVACGLKKLGAKCGFCGCVGEDLIGDFLEDFAKSRGFDYLHLVRDQTRNTTLAFVELNEAGERKFSFFRKNTADYALPAAAADEIADIAHVAHLGSLPLTQPQGRAFADTLIAKMHAKGKKVTFDVNYRDDLFANEEEGVALYKKYVEAADIVKFSEEELVLFAAGETPEDRLKTIAGTDKVALVTLGERGSVRKDIPFGQYSGTHRRYDRCRGCLFRGRFKRFGRGGNGLEPHPAAWQCLRRPCDGKEGGDRCFS